MPPPDPALSGKGSPAPSQVPAIARLCRGGKPDIALHPGRKVGLKPVRHPVAAAHDDPGKRDSNAQQTVMADKRMDFGKNRPLFGCVFYFHHYTQPRIPPGMAWLLEKGNRALASGRKPGAAQCSGL